MPSQTTVSLVLETYNTAEQAVRKIREQSDQMNVLYAQLESWRQTHYDAVSGQISDFQDKLEQRKRTNWYQEFDIDLVEFIGGRPEVLEYFLKKGIDIRFVFQRPVSSTDNGMLLLGGLLVLVVVFYNSN